MVPSQPVQARQNFWFPLAEAHRRDQDAQLLVIENRGGSFLRRQLPDREGLGGAGWGSRSRMQDADRVGWDAGVG